MHYPTIIGKAPDTILMRNDPTGLESVYPICVRQEFGPFRRSRPEVAPMDNRIFETVRHFRRNLMGIQR